ncbi:hypothetical protein BDQ17DRAFT_1353733 [Cyathus striatus]|nr:hypothetical protein BDQ17DRAFT_1353733 [Cyathus striatus]
MTVSTNSPDLFPEPVHRGRSCTWENSNATATAALQRILNHNHGRWHVYINDKRFHSHTAHNVLTLWALGGNETELEASYKESSKYHKPAIVPPGKISRKNWKEYLGDASYYQAYLDFFRDEVKENGIKLSLEEYIFSKNANVACRTVKSPDMLSRMLDQLMHPLIHLGFACEFGQPGLIAEGLAYVAVHKDSSRAVITIEEGEPASDCASSQTDTFTVLKRVIEDPDLGLAKFEGYLETAKKLGEKIKAYATQWSLEGSIDARIEELAWITTMMYGIGGWEGPDKKLNADFFHFHLLTSSMSLSSLATYLNPASQRLLLRNYFNSFLVWYVARGRATINIERFYMDDAGSSLAKVSESSILLSENGTDVTVESIADSKSWSTLRYEAIHHPDEHFSSLQRPLLHYSKMYGETPKGTFANSILDGAEELDGSLFLRVARLTSERTTWRGDGQLDPQWDYRGFYSDESKKHRC